MKIDYTLNIIGSEILAGIFAIAKAWVMQFTLIQAVVYFFIWWIIGFIVWCCIDAIKSGYNNLKNYIEERCL